MARVVITMDGGLIQHIMSDQEGIEVMILDFDTKDLTPEEKQGNENIKQFEGNEIYAFQGVDDVNPDRVNEIESALFK
jgi:hypothetical protein